VTVAIEQGCLRCAPAANLILGIVGERDAVCGRCARWVRARPEVT
jgi:hypothetical protein